MSNQKVKSLWAQTTIVTVDDSTVINCANIARVKSFLVRNSGRVDATVTINGIPCFFPAGHSVMYGNYIGEHTRRDSIGGVVFDIAGTGRKQVEITLDIEKVSIEEVEEYNC